MLYHRHSLRRFVQLPVRYLRNCIAGRRRYAGFGETVRAYYDANTEGEAPPHTDFVSRRQVRRSLFKDFSRVRIDTRNCDAYVFLRGSLDDAYLADLTVELMEVNTIHDPGPVAGVAFTTHLIPL